MAITRDQALAVIDSALRSPRMRQTAEALLGWGALPEKTGDFDSQDSDTLDRCEGFAELLREASQVALSTLAGRARQTAIPGLEIEDGRRFEDEVAGELERAGVLEKVEDRRPRKRK